MINTLFRSLRHYNFRLFWFGQLISLVGTWMQTVAQAWLVLELTGSSLKLGIVSALQFAPMLFLSFFAGAVIDYFPKRKIIIVAQIALMLQAFVLAALDWTGVVRYWHVVVLATLLGIANTIDMPARQSFIIELVGRDDLMNAIGLNAAIFNAARALGPALAGVLIAAADTAVCFFFNGLSFVAVLIGLFLMRMGPEQRKEKPSLSVLKDIEEGLRYIRSTPVVVVTIVLVSVISIFAANFNVLVPVFARSELLEDARGFGFLMSSFGAGALLGAVTLTVLSKWGPRPSFLLGAGAGLSSVLVLIGAQHSYGATAVLLGLAGWFMVSFFGTANATVQLNTEDRLRGRVMSIYTLSFAGLSPFGSLFAGSAAHWLSAAGTFALGGLISGVFFATVILKRSKILAGGRE
jgi:MFS family permease